MASSVSSERAFSAAGMTITKRRNRLKADIVEALQFLKWANGRKDFFADNPTVDSELSTDFGDNTVAIPGTDDSWSLLIEETEDIIYSNGMNDDTDDIVVGST